MTLAEQFFAAGSSRRFAPLKWPAAWAHLPKARLQSITEGERASYERELLDRKSNLDADKLLVAKCRLMIRVVVDHDGQPIFNESQIPQMMATDSALTNHVYGQCKKHCGFDEDDIERLVGNSGETNADGSRSVLRLVSDE